MAMYPCVILAGGLGTRLRESTEFRPKPMIEKTKSANSLNPH